MPSKRCTTGCLNTFSQNSAAGVRSGSNGSKLDLGTAGGFLAQPFQWANMNTACEHPRFFPPHANLSDAVNRNIVQSEVEGGVHLHDLSPGTVLEVRTQNRAYTILYKGWDQALISGHPVFCPQPVPVTIHGSTWGGSMLKARFIGRGMRLEFGHPEFDPIRTSVILEVRSL
jgi:hypothetical protein